MRPVTTLWKSEPRARWFFAAHIQGSLGAAAYITRNIEISLGAVWRWHPDPQSDEKGFELGPDLGLRLRF